MTKEEQKPTIERRLTAAVREADQAFERVGGSTRHYVNDCLLPMLEAAGLSVVDTAHLRGLEAGTVLTQAQTDILTEAMRESRTACELAEANAAHDDAETRVDAALLDLRIANEALATFNARVLGLEAELAEARRADWTTGICSKHQQPDPLCRICNPAIATARASALEEAARWHDAQAAELVIQFFPAHHRDALGGPVRAHDPEVFEEWAEHRRAATSIRALAKSPPSGRFVADEVMERVKAALRGLMGRLAMVAESPNRRQALDLGEAALAALNAEKQR